MDQFNKAISFLLGLVVVAVFIAVASGRINIKKLPFFSKSTVTVTPTPTVTVQKTNQQTSLLGNLFSFMKPKVTPTPTNVPKKILPTIIVIGDNNTGGAINPKITSYQQTSLNDNTNSSAQYHNHTDVQGVSSIPNTGPELLFPLIFASLFGGIYLKKRSM